MIRFSKLPIFHKFQATLKENPPMFFNGNISEVVKLFRDYPSSYVYVGRSHDATIFAKEGCNLQQIRLEDPENFPAGFVFRKNSTPIVNKLNEAIHRNFAFTQTLIDYYRTLDKDTCPQTTSTSTSIRPLGLLALFGSFALLLFGIFCSFCYLLVENAWFSSRKIQLIALLESCKHSLWEMGSVSTVWVILLE